MMLEQQLSRLETSDLVRRASDPELAYFFKHALVQDTTLGSLLNHERKRLHHLVAQTLEQINPERRAELAPLLARHFAYAGDDPKTLEYETLAGDTAARVNANTEACEHYARAIELAQRLDAPGIQLQELFLKNGRVLELQGNFRAALENYTALERLASTRGDSALELAAIMAAATVVSIPSEVYDVKRARALNERALAQARQVDDKAAQAKILWNLMLMYSRVGASFNLAFSYGEQALQIARENNLREQLAYVLNDFSPMLFYHGEPERGAQYNLEARAMWIEFQNLPMLADNYGYAVMNHLVRGEFAEAIAACNQALRLSRDINNEWNEAFAQTWVGEAYLELGDVETAERVMRTAIELGERVFPPTLVITRSSLARLYVDLGNAPRGIELAELAIRVAEERYPPVRLVAFGALLHALIEEGFIERAGQLARDAPEMLTLDGNPMFQSEGMTGLIRVALAEKNFERALELCQALRAFCEQKKIRQFLPLLLRAQALAFAGLAQLDDAAQNLAEARALATEMNARWSLWQILAVSARIENARGSAAQAASFRAQAVEWIEYIAARTPQEHRAGFLEHAYKEL